MWNDNRRYVGTINTLPGVRQDGGLKLSNGVLTDWVDLRVQALATFTGDGTAVPRNRGSAAALLEEVVLDENGGERINIYGPVLRVLAEMNARSPLPFSRIPTLANGTIANGAYKLDETIRIYFAWPESAKPTETSFAEKNAAAVLRILVREVLDPVKALVTLNTAALAVTGITVDIVQGFSMTGDAPLFIPQIRSTIFQVNGALNGAPDYIRSPYKIRAMVYSQEVELAAGGRVEVTDILTKLALRGDRQFPMGPEPIPFAMLAAENAYAFGGANTQAHLGLNFVKRGRLSTMLDPASDTNMRSEYTGGVSATAGQSQIRTTYVELMEVPGLTVPASSRPF